MPNSEKILVVEDEATISRILSTVLTANGYQVLNAENGQQALSMASSHCPDLILLDLGLPGMDGIEVIRRLREWSGTPILVVSARDQEEEKVRAFDLGADDYITKPFGTSELLARIRAARRHANQVLVPGKDLQTGHGIEGHLRHRIAVDVEGQAPGGAQLLQLCPV